jgi:hypothetical protein
MSSSFTNNFVYQNGNDGPTIDSSLTVRFNEVPGQECVFVYVCKADTLIFWKGYNRAHRQSHESWAIIEPKKISEGSEYLIIPPDDISTWEETFTDYSHVYLLLLEYNQSLDSLIMQKLHQYWNNNVSLKSAREEIEDEIDDSLIMKRWHLTEGNVKKWEWILEYP